jgi:hypothetical protein
MKPTCDSDHEADLVLTPSVQIWPRHCSSVYSFLKFIFYLKFAGNSFKVQKFIENEIGLIKI